MMRAVADADNARKRAQAEAAAAQKYALERFAEGLLPVLDSLEAAVKSGDTSGVELTLKQLRGALEKSSVREIDPKPGERFDPIATRPWRRSKPTPSPIPWWPSCKGLPPARPRAAPGARHGRQSA